jgi:DNA-binding response OmpR family regulator
MPATVLIAEDEPHIVESLVFLLSREGFDVVSKGDGPSALAAVLETPPSVLVLDAMLPGLSGFDVLRRVRAQPELESLPILMLTAKGQKRDREVAEQFGVSLFMTKPFSNAEVVEAIKRLAA